MSLLRPLGFLLIILIIGFIISHSHLNLTSFQNLNLSAIKNGGSNLAENIQQKIEENLPPPLRGGLLNTPAPEALSTAGIIAETNVERKDNGNLASLKENAKLDAAALAKVKDMFAKQYFEHTSPSGITLGDLDKAAGYSYVTIGENLALGNFASNQELLQAWMNSPGHRANILNTHFTEMGAAAMIGTYQGHSVWMAVQEFGKPLSACSLPDPNLEATIESLKTDLDNKATAIEEKKKEIDNTYPKSGNTYNAEVDEYNQMIADYNTEVAKLRADISIYNQEVRAYNACS
jgi:uncharacterized protein YkwD